jgi:proline iminopeptidase
MKKLFKSLPLVFLLFQVVLAQNNYSKGELVKINGTKLFVKTMGSGEPIVMVHGGPGFNYLYFLPQFKELAKHYKLIFYDQRVCGKSSEDLDSSSITIENFVNDLEGIRRLFGLKKMILFGHSWGGFLAMKYAIKYPKNLKSLILSNPTPANSRLRDQTYTQIGPRTTQKDIAEKKEITSTKKFVDKDPETMVKYFKNLFGPAFYNRKYIDSLNLKFPPDYKKRNNLLNYLFKDPSFIKYDLTKELYKIKCPTLIVTGDYDIMVPESNQIIHRTIVNSKLVILKHCGHFPFVEDKKEYFAVLENFLASINKKN